MKKKIKLGWVFFLPFYLFTFLPLTVSAQEYRYETVPGDPMNARIYTLQNGLKVYLSVYKERPRIQTYIAVRTGGKNDPAETTGLAHYLEHLMFKGTKLFGTNNPEAEAPLLEEIEQRYEVYRQLTDPDARREAYHEIDSVSQLAAQYFIPNEYDKLMAAIGAEGTNAYTSNDVTCYTEDIPSNEVENWAKIQADRFQNMVIRGFHTELEAVYEEFNINLTRDGRKAYQALLAKLFPSHPYGQQSVIGTQEHLKNPSITNIKNYFNKWYVPNNTAICMSGDFDPDQVIRIIDKYFGQWKPSTNLVYPTFPQERPITAPVDSTVIGNEAENIMMGWRFKGAGDAQVDTLSVISDMLANGRAGLFELNLEEPMKLMGASAYVYDLADYSAFVLSGRPKEGQSLDEVRSLLLSEMENLKNGNFSENLLPSVINNIKRSYYRLLEDNGSRADMFVNSFINGTNWADEVGYLDRVSKITRQQIIDFAKAHFNNDYVCIYKRQGVDTTQKAIDKPVITPIPTNRDQSSQFLRDIQASHVEPIQPRFVDFKNDLTIASTKKGLPVLYKQNTENGLFTLEFYYEFGDEDDPRYEIAAEYLMDYLGTKKKTAAQFKQAFYELACDAVISTGTNSISVAISGLNDNMEQALQLLEDRMQNAVVDTEAYQQYVDIVLKARADRKANQQSNFSYLRRYAQFEKHFPMMTNDELKNADPQVLVNLIKGLKNYKHTIFYYGPTDEQAFIKLMDKKHGVAKKLLDVPEGEVAHQVKTPVNDVWFAPYDAKNIYMVMFHNEDRPWHPEEAALKELFNEYFGGSMNAIVFQEMREARGLAYSASARYNTPYRKGFHENYVTNIATQADKMVDCITHFNEILDTIPQSQAAFDIAKEALMKRLASQRTTKFDILNAYWSATHRGIDYDENELIYRDLPKVTLQDLVNFEKTYMAHKTYRYIILGNEELLDMDYLRKIGPLRKLTTDEVFGY